MKKILLLTFVIFMSALPIIFAKNINIIGSIKDSLTLDALPFVNAVVFQNNDFNKPISGTTTDTLGRFTIKNLKKQNLTLRISFIGYNPLEIQLKSSDFKSDTFNLEEIFLKPASSSLGEVNIEAKVERFEVDEEKLTMNVDEGLASVSNNAFELLKKVPGIFIDKDENITLNGKGGVLFQFNGRDRKIQWSALVSMLKGMTPDQIDKFEVFSNPSAKYDAEGTSGIINIKFKNDRNYGLNGSVNAGSSYEYDFNYNGSVNLNYIDDKWSISANYGMNQYRGKGNSKSYRYVSLSNVDTILFRSEQEYKWRQIGQNVNFSADYLIDTNNSIGLSLSYNKSGSPWIDMTYPTLISKYPDYFGVSDSSYLNNSGSENNTDGYYMSLYYTHNFDTTGTKLSADFSSSISDSYNNSSNGIKYYIGDDYSNLSRMEAFMQNTISKNRHFSFKTDFLKPFDKKTKLEIGLKTAFTFADNNFNASMYDTNLNDYKDNVNRSNQFQYFENINAAYASFSKTLGTKTTLRAGLRLEQTNTKGYQVKLDSTNTNSYINLFPSVSLSYAFKPDNRISLSYNYRISRPSYGNLNPFVEKSNDYYYSKGNPLLEPQFSHSVTLSYSWKYMLFPSISYSYTNNSISSLDERLPNSIIIVSTPYNIRTSHNLNTGVSFNKSVFDWWTIFAYASGNYSQTNTNKDTLGIDMSSLSFSVYGGMYFTLPYKYRLNMFYYYSSGGMWGVYKYDGWQGGDVSLSKSFFKEKLDVSFGIGNLLTKQAQKNESNYNGIISKSEWSGTRLRYSLSLRYNFGKMYERKNKLDRIKSDSEDSRATGGTGGVIRR